MKTEPSPRAPRLRALASLGVIALATLAAACDATMSEARPRFVPRGRRGHFRDSVDMTVFQRGNIHTHSWESDGDSPPEDVYAWYRDHGYNFLALTDHNKRTDPDRYRGLERPGFVLLSGEEITLKPAGRHVHVNAICHRRRIGGRRFGSVEEGLRWAVSRTIQEGGIAMINHPNFHWAFGAEALPAGAQARMLEIWSGHPQVHWEGDYRHPSAEAIWDEALTQGAEFAPAAVDDMHALGAGRNMSRAGPGRGWLEVAARQADEGEICESLRRGWFIASSGVRIGRFTVRGDAMSIWPRTRGGTVEFIGSGGTLLAQQDVDPSGRANVYRLRGGEGYVRARVTARNGARAWTPAYRVTY
jgi:hypothetical protein